MARKQKKYHYIYKTTCVITNKFYIGMHSAHSLDDGYQGSGKRLRYSIRKYGKENHKVEILEFLPDRDSLSKREAEIVNEELVNKHICMNLALGGQGGIFSEEHHLKMREGASEWAIEKHKDPEFFRKNREVVSRTITRLHKEGKFIYGLSFKGKKHSEETKLKMSKSKKGKGLGKANSQYGTCWICNEFENKKIKKEDLEIFLTQGWIKGRI